MSVYRTTGSLVLIQIEVLDMRRTKKGVKQTRQKKPAKEPEKLKDNDADLLGNYIVYFQVYYAKM